MNIDERIKKELETDAQEIDQLIAEDPGLFKMLGNSFKGSMRFWVVLVNIVTLVATALLFWSGYRFYIAELVNDQIFWGVSFLLFLNMQVALKMWIFIEMSRSSVIREVKRLELSVAELSAKLKS